MNIAKLTGHQKKHFWYMAAFSAAAFIAIAFQGEEREDPGIMNECQSQVQPRFWGDCAMVEEADRAAYELIAMGDSRGSVQAPYETLKSFGMGDWK